MIINCTDFNGTDATERCNATAGPLQMPSVLTVAFLSSIYGIISLVALIGNTLVCLVILKNPSMRTVTNAFLLNLAISDIMFIIVTVPGFLVLLFSPTWPLGEGVCKAIPFLNTVALSASIYTMVALAIDRYNAIVHPLRAKVNHTIKRATVVILLIWVLSAIVAFPQILSRSLVNGGVCREDWSRLNHLLGKRMYSVAIFLIFFAVPVTIITIAYVTIIKRLRKTDSHLKGAVQIKYQRQDQGTDPLPERKYAPVSKKKRKSLFMMLTVIVAFLVCMLPFNVLLLVYPFLKRRYSVALVQAFQVLGVLAVCSSACNPIIYNFFSVKFRRAFANIFVCKCKAQETDLELRQLSMGTKKTSSIL